jgi:tetratricopeptide (TPR) repeat protein
MLRKICSWFYSLTGHLLFPLDTPQALAEAEERERATDRAHEAIVHLLQVLRQDLEPQTRLQALEDHLTLYPESDPGRRFYLHLLATEGRAEAALALCQEYQQLRPEGGYGWVGVSLLSELGRHEEALALCEEQRGNLPYPGLEYPLALRVVELRLAQGQLEEARVALHQARSARRHAPSSEEFLLEAELEALAGERETAARLLKRALWSTHDDGVRPIQEKVGRLRQRYGL